MCKLSESHKGGGGGGELGGGGVMDITCYWSTVFIVMKKKKKVLQSVVIVLEIRQMYSELCRFFVARVGTKRLWEQCSDATLSKVSCLVASAVGDGSGFEPQRLRKDHTVFAQVQLLESCFTFGRVVPMRVIYGRVSTETMQQWAVCLNTLPPPPQKKKSGDLTQGGNLLFLPDLFLLKGGIL